MTQSELISKLNEAANTIARGSVRGSANYMLASKEFVDYFDSINSKAERRKEKINKILNAGE
jgi:hypothetical protein